MESSHTELFGIELFVSYPATPYPDTEWEDQLS